MLKAVEFGLLAVSLLVILGLIVVGPGAYSRSREDWRAGDRCLTKSANLTNV